jgi:acetylornithine deacetylase/succinyl-diaminopimelate desuccinylase
VRISELDANVGAAASAELLSTLVRIPSHRGLDRQEEGVAKALAGYLTRAGLEPRLEEVSAGRPNLLCSLRGRGAGRHLLLCGHTDTVRLNEGDPGFGFSGELRDGRVLGRGSVDMKGALVSMAGALVGLKRTGALNAGRVTLAAVVDEEMESLGAEHLVASGFTADGAIVGEPTENRICLGHKGLEWLEISFQGKAAHGGTPERGVNAIEAAGRFVHRVRSELVPRFAERSDPLLGPPTLNFGTIQGGDQPSTVAATCTLTADRRSVPGEDFASLSAELQEVLGQVEAEMPGLATRLCRLDGGMATLEHLALKTEPTDRLALAAAAARRDLYGSVDEYGAFPAWTDGALLAAFGKIPTIVMGPGDLAVAHSPRESIAIQEVVEAGQLYARTCLEFCGGAA